MANTAGLGKVWMHQLAKSGYKTHKFLKYITLAQTVSARGVEERPDAFCPHKDTSPIKGSYVETPRWMLLGREEASYRVEVLEVAEEVKALGDSDKLVILKKLFPASAAETGVLFVEPYGAFKRSTIDPLVQGVQTDNLSDLEIHFIVSGVVQQCGTRGAFSRLFNMVRLNPNAKIKVDNVEEDPSQVSVTITGDLFSAYLFLGLISPDLYTTNHLKAPRIFHGVDIGWDLAPHNLVVAAINRKSIELPLGMHIYTINVEGISKVEIRQAGKTEEIEVPEEAKAIAIQLQRKTHEFISRVDSDA